MNCECLHIKLEKILENKMEGIDGKNFVTEHKGSDSLHAMRTYQDTHRLA